MTNKLDFPKGKANQFEDDVACAVREIKEEIALDVSGYIRRDRFIQMQTIKGKWVKLFIITIDEDLVNMRLKSTNEVQAIKWISVIKYLSESLKFGMRHPNQSMAVEASDVNYQTFLVKGFAFQIC